MRRYDTIFIADPDLSDENRLSLFDRLKDLITQHGGYIAKFDEWGMRKLAYEVKKKMRGFYVLMDFCSQGSLVLELERIMRIDDRVLKFLTVQTNPDVNLEAVKEQMAKDLAEKEAARKAAAEKAEAAKIEAAKQQEAAEKAEAQKAQAAEEKASAKTEDAPAEDAPVADEKAEKTPDPAQPETQAKDTDAAIQEEE